VIPPLDKDVFASLKKLNDEVMSLIDDAMLALFKWDYKTADDVVERVIALKQAKREEFFGTRGASVRIFLFSSSAFGLHKPRIR
jgi:hypothetical protein